MRRTTQSEVKHRGLESQQTTRKKGGEAQVKGVLWIVPATPHVTHSLGLPVLEKRSSNNTVTYLWHDY